MRPALLLTATESVPETPGGVKSRYGFGVGVAGFAPLVLGVVVVEAGFAVLPAGCAVAGVEVAAVLPPVAEAAVVGVVVPVEAGIVVGVTGWPGSGSGRLRTPATYA